MNEIAVPDPKPKHAGGRPTKYDPIYCELVGDLGREGMGRHEIKSAIGCAWSTLQKWEKDFPEFAEALAEASHDAQAWWAAQGRRGIFMGPQFNASAYALQVKNRFPRDWKDKHDHVVEGGITVTITSDDAKL